MENHKMAEEDKFARERDEDEEKRRKEKELEDERALEAEEERKYEENLRRATMDLQLLEEEKKEKGRTKRR
ncbi:MAG: hypothetical protein Q8835_02635 [Sweet potato little leaf phytoplasma]|nr:hypothetical protein [Sweet potato little leaf phytoplasma]